MTMKTAKRIILCDDTEIEKVSQKAKKHKLGIEIQSFYDPSFCEDFKQIKLHQNLIKRIELLSFHAPFGDLCPGSFDPMVRSVAKNRFELGYDIAKKLGVSHMVFHIGYVPGTGPIKRWSSRCINFWNEFLEGKSEMQFYIENMLEYDPEMLLTVIEGLDKKNVKVCLDLGHAHCYSKTNVLNWIKILKDKIGYVHIHDNNGEKDEHLGIGKGNIPMVEALTLLNKYAPNSIWAIEAKVEDMEETIKWLKTNNFL